MYSNWDKTILKIQYKNQLKVSEYIKAYEREINWA